MLVEALPQALRLRAARAAASSCWSTRTRRRSRDDPFAGDHHVADVAGRQPEDPVPGEALRVERRRRGVVEDDEVGGRAGLERPEQRLAEDAAGEPRRLGEARERPVDARAPRSSSRSRKYAACDSSNMSEPIPSVPSASRAPSRATRARPTELFMFERALCATVAFAPRDERDLRVVEMDAVGEQRALVERAARASRSTTRRRAATRRARRRRPRRRGRAGRRRTRARRRRRRRASRRESVNDACAPTRPRASGGRSRRTRSRKRRFSASPARARSGPSRSVVS